MDNERPVTKIYDGNEEPNVEVVQDIVQISRCTYPLITTGTPIDALKWFLENKDTDGFGDVCATNGIPDVDVIDPPMDQTNYSILDLTKPAREMCISLPHGPEHRKIEALVGPGETVNAPFTFTGQTLMVPGIRATNDLITDAEAEQARQYVREHPGKKIAVAAIMIYVDTEPTEEDRDYHKNIDDWVTDYWEDLQERLDGHLIQTRMEFAENVPITSIDPAIVNEIRNNEED